MKIWEREIKCLSFSAWKKENKPGKAKGTKSNLKIQTDENATKDQTHKGLEQNIQHEGEKEKEP